MKKIKEIQEITGDTIIDGVDPFGLDDGFDPNTYDQQMENMFGDDYYNDDNYNAEEEEAAIEAMRGELADEASHDAVNFKPQKFLRESIDKMKKITKKQKKNKKR